jgi:hypothetical protein
VNVFSASNLQSLSRFLEELTDLSRRTNIRVTEWGGLDTLEGQSIYLNLRWRDDSYVAEDVPE